MIRVKIVGITRESNVAVMTADSVSLCTSSPADPEAAALILELNEWLNELYHPDDNHFSMEADEVSGNRGTFVLARLEGRPAGCGGVRLLDDGRAEIKRMYVRPEARGRGIGRRILLHLEQEARTRGAQQLLLEMGGEQPEARSLYSSFGLEPVPCWGEYLATAQSVCLGKYL